MENIRVRSVNIDEELWLKFVTEHPKGTIFQTPQYYNLHKGLSKYDAEILTLQEEDEIAGVLLAIKQSTLGGILSFFSSRYIIIGGPLVKDDRPDLVRLLLSEYCKKVKSKAIYTQIRNIWDTTFFKTIAEECKFKYEEHLDIFHDLTLDEQQQWIKIKSTRRKHINRSKRSGVEINAEWTPKKDDVKICYNIIKAVYSDVNLPVAKYEYFLKANKTMKGQILYFIARKENEIIGVRIVLCFKKLIYDWYAGGKKEYYHLYPNDILPWSVFMWGHENGYELFDFGGAGKPNKQYGVRDYKLKFGGDLVNFGRYEWYHNQLLMKLAKLGFDIWKKIKI
jgi:lipid II:glycine glycyltransferase (peptidoglycan interpeptide bridge formation enzyme)